MSDRRAVSLGEVFEIARGGSPRPIDAFVTDSPNGVNWITIGDASEGSKYITSTKRRIRPEGAHRSREVRPGDFLLTNSMSFGRPYIMQTSGCIHDGWLVLSPRRDDVDPNFIYHLLSSRRVYSEFERRASGATVKNLNIELVRGVTVSLPLLSEQRRIAAILDKTDELRAKRRAAIAQLETLTQAIFLDMFGDPATNPKGWSIGKIGDVGEVQGGLQITSARQSLPHVRPYLRVANVHRGRLDLSEVKTIRANSAEIARATLVNDDLLIVEGHGNKAEIGRAALWDGSIAGCVHQNHLIRVRFDRAWVDPCFAIEYLNSPGGRRHLLRASNTTSGLNTISVADVRQTPLALPPVDRQVEFAGRAARVTAASSAQRAFLAEQDALFASLQDRAFRGEL